MIENSPKSEPSSQSHLRDRKSGVQEGERASIHGGSSQSKLLSMKRVGNFLFGPDYNIVVVPQGVIFFTLCILVFAAGILTLKSVTSNAIIITTFESVVFIFYLVFLRKPTDGSGFFRTKSLISFAVAAWFVSISISLITSNFEVGVGVDGLVGGGPLGLVRYQQSVIHVMFFLAVRDIFSRYPLPIQWVLIAIPASCFVVAMGMANLIVNLDHYGPRIGELWFKEPPFAPHIRFTGYQVTASISALMAFFVSGRHGSVNRILLLLVLVTLCTLLFWMGGRASLVSILGAFVFLAFVLRVKGVRSRELWLAFFFSMAAGLLLAEGLAVFNWNGFIDLATRTVEANDYNQLGTGRLAIWLSSWESIKEYPLFGLGPQGYLFMPNRVFGVQPHNFVVQFLVEWGFVGTFLFLGLMLYGFYHGFVTNIVQTKGDVDVASLSAGAMIVALTIHGLVDGTYYHPQPSLYLAIGFAVWTLPRPTYSPASRS